MSKNKIESKRSLDKVEEADLESFPASDAPAWAQPGADKTTSKLKKKIVKKDIVQEASEESFPASDPPPWTSGIEPDKKDDDK